MNPPNDDFQLVSCPMCNKPLAKRKGDIVKYLKMQDGKAVVVTTETKHYSGNGHYKISCECGGGHIFATIHENMGISEEIDVKKENS
ncbi:MAG TPA: hypothetical protein DHS36_01205 [Candidatus Veblenbacteria bacterium]|uniref:Uncharacterized protein n=1 Tax=Candidatus Giovannonibacteria bacterium GW2011_GWF2_42_19 TaxID=1618659 RepID=A0A0G0ZEV1_9BACT|nr:MAG: hypothetical protein UV11_C0018G0003 [Candidatus Giovannonibacteria bacterium GW2011_GWF2_42_19]HCX38866.1 hypothetical protein [Candidatus Veblenbacteria bacterium]